MQSNPPRDRAPLHLACRDQRIDDAPEVVDHRIGDEVHGPDAASTYSWCIAAPYGGGTAMQSASRESTGARCQRRFRTKLLKRVPTAVLS